MTYKLILADPPWRYDNKATGGTMVSGSADKYPTMSVRDLIRMRHVIKQIRHEDGSVLFLWATVPLLPEAMSVMEAWGYKYKTLLVWHKTGRLGMGFWFRGNVELLLMGVCGKVKPFRQAVRNIFEENPRKHSRKPEQAFQIIDAIPDMEPRIELFATEVRPGWDCWGYQVEGTPTCVDIFDYKR